jgi:hypothetical protein
MMPLRPSSSVLIRRGVAGLAATLVSPIQAPGVWAQSADDRRAESRVGWCPSIVGMTSDMRACFCVAVAEWSEVKAGQAGTAYLFLFGS